MLKALLTDIRVPNKGMPDQRTGEHGDLVVTLQYA